MATNNTTARTNLIYTTTIAAALTLNASTSHARLTPLAITGDNAPNAAGTPDGLFADLMRPAINHQGQVAFSTTLSATSSGAFNNSAYYRTTESGPIVQIARENDLVPTSGAIAELEAPQTVNINEVGQVIFTTRLAGVSTAENTAIYLGSGGPLTQIARELLTPAPGAGAGTVGDLLAGTFGPPIPQLNNLGQVAFYDGDIQGTIPDSNEAIFRGAGGDLTMLAREGNEISRPSGSGIFTITQLKPAFSRSFSFNDLGQAAFVPDRVDGGSSRQRLVRSGGPNRGEELIMGNFTTLESGLEIIDFTDTIAMNNSGFVSAATAGSSDADELSGVLITDKRLASVGEPDQDFAVAQFGDTLPGTSATLGRNSSALFDPDQLAINESNQTAFAYFDLLGTADPGLDGQVLLRAQFGSEHTILVRAGQPVPGGNGTFDSFPQNTHGLALNKHGVVLFDADLRDTAAGTNDDKGLYLSDGIEQFEITREGAPLNGSTVTAFAAALKGSGGDDSKATSLNNSGQVAYSATLADGTSGVFLYTPEVNWRTDTTGDWDDNTNWTLSLAPGNPHDVTINPDFSLTVQGPTTPTTIRNLTLGGDGSTATLVLQGNNLTAANTVQIHDNALLTGDGTLNANAENHGTVIPDKLTINGTLTNHNLITGDGTLDGDIVNATGGTVRALNNHIQFPSGLTNDTGALIAARDALLEFGTGLDNNGNLTVSFGTSDIFGPITNNATGRIIASGNANLVFHDDITNNGNIQVSTGSTAVYFGDVTGTGSYTGGGTNFFEADFSPGASPATIDFNADLTLSATANLILELTHEDLGGHDQLNITGNLHAAGKLTITLLDNYHPQLHDTFQLLTFTTTTGAFTTTNLPPLNHGLAFDTTQLLTTGTLTVIPEPNTFTIFTCTTLLLLKRSKYSTK